LVKALPGPLDFVIRWNGPADINLELFVEKGNPLTIISQGFQPTEFLYPGFGCNVTPDGGYIAYDNRGGPKGGMEIASFPSVPAEAAYGIAALFITGKPVDVTIDAFINGQKGQIFFLANPNNVNSLTIANQEVQKLRAPGDFATANFTIPALFPSGSAKQAAKHKANSDAEAVSAVAPTPTLAASGRR
jgi:hypothetical protein